MAYMQTELQSKVLGKTTTLGLFFPNDYPPPHCHVQGVITLLHGIHNNFQGWLTYTGAARYAADNGYILLLPSCENSFYHDMQGGSAFYTYLTEELPCLLSQIFRLPAEREKNFIAGFSMGGYGALRLGLSQPDKYAACGSFSGPVKMQNVSLAAASPGHPAYPSLMEMFSPVFGPDLIVPPEANLFELAAQVAKLPAARQPRLFVSCGDLDNDERGLLQQNREFKAHLEALPLPLCYRELPGAHEWGVAGRGLVEFIAFIQGSNYADIKKNDWAAPSQDYDNSRGVQKR